VHLNLTDTPKIIATGGHALIYTPEINVRVLADAVGIKAHQRIPFHICMDLLLTGCWMKAEEAPVGAL